MRSFEVSHFHELKRRLGKAWGSLPESERDEVAQEAVRRALDAQPTLGGNAQALLEAAMARIPALRAERLSLSRRGHDVARVSDAAEQALANLDAEDDHPLQPKRRARPPRRPRPHRLPLTPKGTARAWYAGSEVEHIEQSIGDLPTASDRVAAQQIVLRLIAPISRKEPIPTEDLEALRSLHQALFAHRPEYTWARFLAEEICRAASHRLNDEVKQAPRPEFSNEIDGDHVTVRMLRRPEALKLNPNTPHRIDVALQAELISTHGDSALFALKGELDGKWQTIGWAFGTLTNGSRAPSVPYDPEVAARLVLLTTIARAANLPGGQSLPEFALDLQLIQFLIGRMGFEGGGGAARKLTKRRIVQLLTCPSALADDVEAYGARRSRRITDEVEQGLSELVARLRRAAAT